MGSFRMSWQESMKARQHREAKARRAPPPHLSLPGIDGQYELSYNSLIHGALAPPKFNAQLFSVGRIHLYLPHVTRGSRPFCVCQWCARYGPQGSRFDFLLPSVLSKSPPTLSRWHAQSALFVKHLCACHREWFTCVFARAELLCIKLQVGGANPRVIPWVETDRRRSCCAHGSARFAPG